MYSKFCSFSSIFAATRNLSGNAVRAANAYKSIIEAINEAKKSANEALAAANASAEIVSLSLQNIYLHMFSEFYFLKMLSWCSWVYNLQIYCEKMLTF